MKRILADSSIWIDYLNSPSSASALKLTRALDECEVCICPPVVQEVIQGIRNKTELKSFTNYFLEFKHLEADPYHVAVASASIYRSLKIKGITIRKSWDCQIAWYAIAFDLELLHNDRDFDNIAKVYPLKSFL